MTLAKKLNELRRTRGLTLREVERSTGISNAYLSQIETGKIVNPTIRIVQALADFYQFCEPRAPTAKPLTPLRGQPLQGSGMKASLKRTQD